MKSFAVILFISLCLLSASVFSENVAESKSSVGNKAAGREADKQELGKLQAQLAELNTQLNSAQQQLTAAKNDASKATAALQTATKENAALKATLNELQEKFNKLKAKADADTVLIDTVNKQIKEKEESVKQTNAQVSAKQGELNKLKSEFDEFKKSSSAKQTTSTESSKQKAVEQAEAEEDVLVLLKKIYSILCKQFSEYTKNIRAEVNKCYEHYEPIVRGHIIQYSKIARVWVEDQTQNIKSLPQTQQALDLYAQVRKQLGEQISNIHVQIAPHAELIADTLIFTVLLSLPVYILLKLLYCVCCCSMCRSKKAKSQPIQAHQQPTEPKPAEPHVKTRNEDRHRRN